MHTATNMDYGKQMWSNKMKKIKVLGIIILAIAVIILLFIGKNPLIKRLYDELKNFKSFMVVKTSGYYQNIDQNKKYYKDEKNIRIPILIYHEIPNKEPTRDQFYMQTTAKKFEKQLKGLLDEGYQFISYDNLVEYSKGKKAITEKTLLLGFDDGWIGNYTNAFPILKKYNIPAAIYVVDDQVGTENYFNWEQAKEMAGSGLISIYSHGRTHIYYNKETPETLINDVNVAYENIEKNIGKIKNKVFTYPFGAYTEEQIEKMKQAGFIQNLTDDLINYSNTLDLSRLHRYYVKQNESSYTIIKNVCEL